MPDKVKTNNAYTLAFSLEYIGVNVVLCVNRQNVVTEYYLTLYKSNFTHLQVCWKHLKHSLDENSRFGYF